MKLHIEAIVRADKSTVWEKYTNPSHIVNWNFASDDWCCPHAENDLRVGGLYKARMEAKDKSFAFDFEAQYQEVLPEEKLQYLLGEDREVEVIFESTPEGTKIDLTFDAENENPLEMQREGWQAILNHFRDYVESQEGNAK